MAAGARVLVIEMIIPDQPWPGPAPWMDLNMLVMLGGRERTAATYQELLLRAGLTTSRGLATPSPVRDRRSGGEVGYSERPGEYEAALELQ